MRTTEGHLQTALVYVSAQHTVGTWLMCGWLKGRLTRVTICVWERETQQEREQLLVNFPALPPQLSL